MKETEITVQVYNSKEDVFNILNNKGYKMIEHYGLNDYYFSKYTIAELKQQNYQYIIKNSFLLRDINEENRHYQLVFKDKTLDDKGNVIAEEKIKCKLDGINNAIEIFNRVGLTCWCNLNQDMYVYKQDEKAFVVQIIDGLGTFIEYEEDDSMKGLTEQQKIDYMLNILKDTGLTLSEDYSCKKVYLKFCKDNNIG